MVLGLKHIILLVNHRYLSPEEEKNVALTEITRAIEPVVPSS
jgi:hypothetical protein